MKKILVITSRYGWNEDATGICAKNVCDELQRRGYELFVISEPVIGKIDSATSLTIKTVEPALFSRISKKIGNSSNILCKLVFSLTLFVRRILVLPSYPNVSVIRSKKIYYNAINLINENDISTVICTYRPYEAIYTALKLKRKYKEKLYVIAYHLDLLTDPNTSISIIRKYQVYRARKIIDKEISSLDKLIFPESVNSGIAYENIDYADFPLYIQTSNSYVKSNFKFPVDTINITYIGTIEGRNRRLDFIEDILKKIPSIHGRIVKLHIWGNIDDADTRELIDKSIHIEYHGVADTRETYSLLKQSDFLLNISNKITYSMIPSKIFQLFSTHKPIIDLVQNPQDASLPYFRRVKDFLIVDVNKDDCDDCIAKYISEFYQKEIDFDDELYSKSRPEYLADIITEYKENMI